MNDSEFFITPFRTADFISIFSSINILSNIFYQENLLTINDKYKAVPVVNSLCQYLHDANNSENAVIALGKKMLNKTHFYGSNDNETLHFKYIDAKLDNFIATVAFSKFGNTFGYLSAIVNGTNNLTLSFLKRKIEKDLSLQTYLNQDYTISRLNQLSVKRITEKLIFPLFPELTENIQLRIVDVDYIYAQAGLMFARSAQMTSGNSSFEEYIAIAQSIEQGVRFRHLNNSALQIFQLPALLYYTHKNPEMFKDVRFDVLINDENFWNSAFLFLFTQLNDEQEKIYGIQKNNPVYLFERALFQYRSRTEYAEYLLRRMCPLEDESEYQAEVEDYKYNNADYHCKTNNFHMPDINELFSQQNEHIAYFYANVEKEIVREAFCKELIKFIEQPNVTVSPIQIQFNSRCGEECAFFKPNVHEDSVLFEIIDGSDPIAYALIRNNNSITLHSSKNGIESFLEKIGLNSESWFTLPSSHKPLKQHNETFNKLLVNLVEPKRLEFYKRLQSQGYEPTRGESIVELLKNLIPFYTCVQTAKTESPVIAAIACIVDSLVLIPLIGPAANAGFKFLNTTIKIFLMAFQSSLKAFSIGQFVKLTLRNLVTHTATEFSSLITKEMFKDIGIAMLRTLDPGIELSYTLGRGGVKAVTKCFKLIGQKVTTLSKVIKSLSNIKQTFIANVANFEGHTIFVNSVAGNDGYGVKYFRLQQTNVELRRVRGYMNEIPVVLVSSANEKKQIYQIIDIESGELMPTRWEVGAKDMLVVETKPLRNILKTIQQEGLSGRGRLINPRIRIKAEWLEMQERLTREWKILIDEDFLSHVLKNYVLDDIVLRTSLLTHLEDYIVLPEWAESYKLTNVNDYEALRYNSYVDDIFLSEEEAVNRVTELHRNKYRTDVSETNPSEMYQFYRQLRLHSVVNFEDFCAIGTYVRKGPERALTESPEGWFIQNAFNKAAMRFIDFPAFDAPKFFYKFEQIHVDVFDSIKPGDCKEFKVLHNLDVEPFQSLGILRKVKPDEVTVNILYEIVVDNSLMIVDVEKILPNIRVSAVGLPNSKYYIQGVSFYHCIAGNIIYKVTVKNGPIDKSKWIATLNKNIETLNKQIETYNDIVDDFNIDFLT